MGFRREVGSDGLLGIKPDSPPKFNSLAHSLAPLNGLTGPAKMHKDKTGNGLGPLNGPRNRTLHLYVVRPTNLLVFGPSRANAETSHSCEEDLVVVEMLWGVIKRFHIR